MCSPQDSSEVNRSLKRIRRGDRALHRTGYRCAHVRDKGDTYREEGCVQTATSSSGSSIFRLLIWRLTLTRAEGRLVPTEALPRTLGYCLFAHKFSQKVSHFLEFRFGCIQWKVPIDIPHQAVQLGRLLGGKFRGAASQAFFDDVEHLHV